MRSVHAGVTKGIAPMKWHAYDWQGFQEVERSMLGFARECFCTYNLHITRHGISTDYDCDSGCGVCCTSGGPSTGVPASAAATNANGKWERKRPIRPEHLWGSKRRGVDDDVTSTAAVASTAAVTSTAV